MSESLPRPHRSTAQPSFDWELRVYWEDTDAGGVVFYANDLRFLERARTEWLRALGFSQQTLHTDAGVMFVVADLHLQYLASARLDDVLRVTVAVQERSAAALRIHQTVYRGTTVLCSAEVRVACVKAADMRPTRIPGAIVQALNTLP